MQSAPLHRKGPEAATAPALLRFARHRQNKRYREAQTVCWCHRLQFFPLAEAASLQGRIQNATPSAASVCVCVSQQGGPNIDVGSSKTQLTRPLPGSRRCPTAVRSGRHPPGPRRCPGAAPGRASLPSSKRSGSAQTKSWPSLPGNTPYFCSTKKAPGPTC